MICLFGRGFESHQLHKRSKRSQKTTSLFLLVLIETAVSQEDATMDLQEKNKENYRKQKVDARTNILFLRCVRDSNP